MKQNFRYMVCTLCWTYNHKSYIEDTLNGFAKQKVLFPIVSIVVDDASPDGEQEVIKKWAKDNLEFNNDGTSSKDMDYGHLFCAPLKGNPLHTFVLILLRENHHYINKSKRPYFAEWFNSAKYHAECEGDDYWTDTDKLQKQVDYMEEHIECSLVCHNALIRNESNGKIIGKHRINNTSGNIPLYRIIRDGGLIPTLSLLYRTSSFANFSDFPANCPVGDLRIQTFAAIVGTVHYIDENMGVYRLVSTSFTHKVANDKDLYVNHHNKFIEWYCSVNEYTKYKYDKEIRGAIAFSKARIFNKEGKYYKLWNPKYYAYIWNEPINSRIGLILRMMGLNFIYLKVHSVLEKRRGK